MTSNTLSKKTDATQVEDVAPIVASRLREMRKNANLTQVDLAEKSGVSEAYIGLVEAGDANVSIGKLALLAHALGKHTFELLLPLLPGNTKRR